MENYALPGQNTAFQGHRNVNHRIKRQRRLTFQHLDARRAFAADFELIDTVRTAGMLNNVVANDNVIYFLKADAQHGEELWRADRDGSNPQLVKDVFPGPQGSLIGSLTLVNDRLFFSADDGVHGRELWTSDGTSANTKLVLNVGKAQASGFVSNLNPREPNQGLIVIGNDVYFEGTTFGSDSSLWVSDGTEEGTMALSQPTPANGLSSYVDLAIEKNGLLLFTQTTDLSTSERSRTLFLGNKTNGFVASDELQIDPSINPPLDVLANLPNGVLFSVNSSVFGVDPTYSLTIDGTIEKISDFSPFIKDRGFSVSKDGYAIGMESLGSGINSIAFLTDGTLAGTDQVVLGTLPVTSILLSHEHLVTAADSSAYRNFIDLTEPLKRNPIDYAPTVQRDIQYFPVSETSFLVFEVIRATEGSPAKDRHVLRLVDIGKKTSRVILDADEVTAISEVLLDQQNVYATLLTKQSTRVVKLDLASLAPALETLANYPVVDLNESVDIRIIDGSLFVEAVSTAKSELLIEDLSGLRLLASVDVGSPDWQDYFPISVPTTFTESGRATVKSIASNGKTIISGLAISSKLSVASEVFVDLKGNRPISGSMGRSLHTIGDSIIYFVSRSAIVDGDTDQISLVVNDVKGDMRELFSLSTSNQTSNVRNIVSRLGVYQGRFYFAVFIDNSWSLYRTNATLDGVELVAESFAGAGAPRVETIFRNDGSFALSSSRNRTPERLVFQTSPYDYIKPATWELFEFDFATDTLKSLPSSSFPVTAGSGTARYLNGARESLWAWSAAQSYLRVEVLQTGVARDFFSASQLAELSPTQVLAARVEGAWFAFVTSSTNSLSIWRLDDDKDTAVRVTGLENESDISFYRIVAIADKHILFQVSSPGAPPTLLKVGDGPAVVSQVTDGESGAPIEGPAYRVQSRSLREDAYLSGGTFERLALNILSESGDSLERLGYFPGYIQDETVEQSGNEILAISRWREKEVYRLILNQVSVTTDDAETEFSFAPVGTDSFELASDGAPVREFDRSSTGSLKFEDFGHAVEFAINIVNGTSSSLPQGGISLSLVAGSRLLLTGSTAEQVSYHFKDDSVEVRIGNRKLELATLGSVVIDDRIAATNRKIAFNEADDNISIGQHTAGRMQLKDLNRGLTILFPAESPIVGQSPTAFSGSVEIDTGVGKDQVRILPELTQTAQLAITSGLDAQSGLTLVLPDGVELPTRHSTNGRTYQSIKTGSLQIQAELSSRPFHNLANPADADGDGSVLPLDALRIINLIARKNRGSAISGLLAYGDVSGDSKITPLDALLVINRIAKQTLGQTQMAAAEGGALDLMTKTKASDAWFANHASFVSNEFAPTLF